MATITPDATVKTSLLSHQAITHPASVYGSAVDVSGKYAATVHLYHALVEATANTNPGAFIIQASAAASGNEDWVDLVRVDVTTDSPATEALTATEASGETVLAVAATAGFVALDDIYIQDAGTLADSEWAKVEQIVTNTSVDITDGLTTGKDASDFLWGSAERFAFSFDLRSVARLRVIFMHEGGTGANCHIDANMTTHDSDTST